jgi:hypothetical protein
MTNQITVTGTETVEEIYFLIRTGVWHQEHVQELLEIRENQGYNQGLDDATAQGYTGPDVDDAYTRGYDNGHNEGFRDGYSQASREAEYDNDRRW